jgi:hypothetical protein
MTVAAVDRLVHHSVIVEMNVDSYRRRQANEAKAKRQGTTTRSSKKKVTDDAEKS